MLVLLTSVIQGLRVSLKQETPRFRCVVMASASGTQRNGPLTGRQPADLNHFQRGRDGRVKHLCN
jgi:hypothetical protein